VSSKILLIEVNKKKVLKLIEENLLLYEKM